jgi:hypothetical protein
LAHEKPVLQLLMAARAPGEDYGDTIFEDGRAMIGIMKKEDNRNA